MMGQPLQSVWLSEHVLQIAVPTPTLPPSFETNTYVVRNGSGALLIDAGSQEKGVLDALCEILREIGISRIDALLATHYHRDHTQGLPYLQNVYDAPIYVHRADFANTQREIGSRATLLNVPPVLQVDGLEVIVEHHPGHTHGHVHLVLRADSVILVGDHLAGDGSVWIGPPDGHMATYYHALRSIAQSGCNVAGPGHGAALQNAAEAANALLERRLAREADIVNLTSGSSRTLQDLVDALYGGVVPQDAMWVATKTVQAHLQHLMETGTVTRLFDGTQFRYES